MAALKGVVAALGILIVLTMTAIGWGFMRKASDPAFSFFGGEAPGAADAGTARFGEVGLGLPPGCTIAEVRPDGKRVYFLIRGGGPCPDAVAIDAASGAVVGTIRAGP